MNGVEIHTRARRYKITSMLRLLLRSDPQDEGLRRLQPRTRLSKLDYFYAGITSTRELLLRRDYFYAVTPAFGAETYVHATG